MKKIALILMLSLMLNGCRFTVDRAPTVYVQEEASVATPTAIYYYEDYCVYEPYYHQAEWCDWYDDDSTCCVWFSDGWYEEYCQWGYNHCWEYNGSF